MNANTVDDFKNLIAKEELSSLEKKTFQDLTNAVFNDLRNSKLTEEDAKNLSDLKSVYHLRGQVNEADLKAILAWSESQIQSKDNEYLLELCIGIARKVPSLDYTNISNTVLSGSPNVSLRIAAVLYLATVGKMNESNWPEQLQIMRENTKELLAVVSKWIEVKSNKELVEHFRGRLADPNYSYGIPYFNMLIREALKADGITIFNNDNLPWVPSINTANWEYVLVSGSLDDAYTVICRCPAGTTFNPWVCDGLTECYVRTGSIILNGVTLETGEYGSVDAGIEGTLSSETGMETLSVMHGKVIFAAEEFPKLRIGPISAKKAKLLSKVPFIDHLRRHATEADLEDICKWLKPTDNEYLIEICIGIARNLLPNKDLDTVVKEVLNGNPGMSLRICAVLYLASKGLMTTDLWDAQIKDMEKNTKELLRVARYFYNAKNNKKLVDVINVKRLDTKKYEYNKPYYELLLRLAK